MVWGDLKINIGRLVRYLLVGGVVLVGLGAAPSAASDRACRQIEARLAALPAESKSRPATRRYDEAIARQQEQLQKARAQANQAGCGRAIVGSAVAFCASVNGSMEKMQRNLAELQAKRGKLKGKDSSRERAQLQAALKSQGCGSQARRANSVPAEARKVESSAPVPVAIGRVSGNFRTMCVRTCDGYYFPISNSVPQSSFERDQQACQAMCPGSPVELHIHRMPGQEAEDMVSASTGQRYRDLANAFVYRKKAIRSTPACSCNRANAAPTSGFTVVGGEYDHRSVNAADATISVPPRPSARPDPAEDPETLANRESGVDIQALKHLNIPKPNTTANASLTNDGAIRVVGPVFLPDPEAAIDLQAPAPVRDR